MRPRQRVIQARALFVLGGLGAFATILAGRLVYLQVFQATALAAKASAQRTRFVDLSSVRGEIVDREGKALALSVSATSVYANPREVKQFDPKLAAEKLSPLLKIPVAELEKRLQGQSFRWLARKQDESLRKAVRELRIPGIGQVAESRREYPKGQLAATLIGFVGIDNQGLAGIEHAFDRVLKGPQTKLPIMIDAYGRELLREGSHGTVDAAVRAGSQVVLTIDENLQHFSERELAKSVEKAGALRGTVMLMEPATGNLLAFATHPTFDPNQYGKYDWQRIKNWPVTDVYEPGSTMKLFTLGMGIDLGKITPKTVIHCPPALRIDGHTVTEHAPLPSTQLSVEQILELSSNVGTTQVAFMMKSHQHRSYLTKLGFGRPSGSGITGESGGVVPNLPWRRITQSTVSFGQGVSVTPLQILTCMSAIANGGVRMAPRLIDRVQDAQGQVLERFPPKAMGRAFKTETCKQVMSMLERVVTKGTGKAAQVPGYTLGGKTGTAQRVREDGRGYSSDTVASFLGFFPADRPRFAMLVLLDRPRLDHWAASTAAPLFGKVAAEVLRYLAIQPNQVKASPAHHP